MLIYSCIVPHSPFLIPNIGKDHYGLFKKTCESLEAVHQQLLSVKPDTVVLIAPPHEDAKGKEHVSLHIPTQYKANFVQFGDLITELSFSPDTVLADQIKSHLHAQNIDVAYDGKELLEYSTGVPLFHLMKGVEAKILVLHPGEANSLADHYALGRALQHVVQDSTKRIALVSSGDLSHCLTEAAPGGFSPAAIKYDQELVSMLKSQRVKKILKLEPQQIREFGVCCIESCVILLGIMHDIGHTHAFHSYEYPLGIGHLVMDFTF